MVLIDMPMPKHCVYCPMMSENHYACKALWKHIDGKEFINLEHRPDWCPLKEVDKEVDTE